MTPSIKCRFKCGRKRQEFCVGQKWITDAAGWIHHHSARRNQWAYPFRKRPCNARARKKGALVATFVNADRLAECTIWEAIQHYLMIATFNIIGCPETCLFVCAGQPEFECRSEKRRVGKEGVSTCRARW